MAQPEEQQMEAVFKSVRTETDPVSGNEVPPGSLPEEVRDDIPAMLSEGEYVVPADVLRYYGVKFFEDLRAQAKKGLAEMDANGRIGGEPIEAEEDDLPFSDEELMAFDTEEEEEMMAATGGLVGFQEGGLNFPAYIQQPDLSAFGMDQAQGGLEYRVYVNEAGMEITIPFFNGEPMAMIPPGYMPQGEAPAKDEETASITNDDGGDDEPTTTADDRYMPDYSLMSKEELDIALKASEEMSKGNNALISLLPMGGVFNAFSKMATKAEQKKIKDAMENAYTKAEIEEGLRSGIDPKTGNKLSAADNDRLNLMVMEDNFARYERSTPEERSRGSDSGVPIFAQPGYQTPSGEIDVEALLPPTPTETTSSGSTTSFGESLKNTFDAIGDFFTGGKDEEDKPSGGGGK